MNLKLRNEKWNLRNDIGPPILGMERTEGKDISMKKRLHFTKKNYTESTLPEIKSWCIDLLAEVHFGGADSLEHRHASLFWSRSGRRLKHV